MSRTRQHFYKEEDHAALQKGTESAFIVTLPGIKENLFVQELKSCLGACECA
jgi:hypothetical protein